MRICGRSNSTAILAICSRCKTRSPAVALNLELTNREAARPTNNPDALDFILQARAAYMKGITPDRLAEIINLYERALALDPHSVEAQSQIANMLAIRAG